MKKIGLSLVLMMSMLVATGDVQGLTIQWFTDPVAWSAAVAHPYTTETFAGNTLHDPELSYTTVMGSIALERWRDVLNATSNHPAQTTWLFATPITAYGGTWTLAGAGGSGNWLVVSLPEYDNQVVFKIPSSYYGTFGGFVADAPFSQVRLAGGTGSHQRMYFLDDMVYGGGQRLSGGSILLATSQNVVANPVPPGVWLAAAGLALFAIRRRARR